MEPGEPDGRPSSQRPEVRDEIARLGGVVEALTTRAREQGTVRDDITGTDIVLLLGGIHHTAAPVLDQQPQAWRRYLALAFDGLFTVDARTLPHRPPTGPHLTGPRQSA